MENISPDKDKSQVLQAIDEKFVGLAEGPLLRVYQAIFDSVKEISSHLRYSTSN